MTTESKQELVFNVSTVAAYDPFRAQLAELKEGNSKAVFDYRDPKGNKEARSHIYKLRQTKAAIDKVRKAEKESSLNYGRLVDSQAKEIIQEVEDMIEVHEKPIREIEEEEKLRVARHENGIKAIMEIGNFMIGGQPQSFGMLFSELELIVIDESWEEFEAQAHREKAFAKQKIDTAFAEHQKREAEQAELERLRKEAAEREQKEREARIAKEATEAAERAAAAEQQRIKDEAERQVREQQIATERAQREKSEAEAELLRQQQAAEQAKAKALLDAENAAKAALAKAEADKQAAIEAERQRVAAELAQQAIEASRREKDTANKKRVNNEILQDFIASGLSEECAKTAITAMAKNQVRNVKINY